jgi:hypothetical protein
MKPQTEYTAGRMRIERFTTNPIVRPHMDGRMGDNINGPSLIRVPEWVERPLGKYYLYFGHHRGEHIRLAYADHLEGPWQTYEPGVLELADSYFQHHIASPDVLVDEERRQFHLYFHGSMTAPDRQAHPELKGQATRVARSNDGLQFTAQPEIFGFPYFRVFRWDGWYYAMAMPGVFYRSRDGLHDFEAGADLFKDVVSDIRHCAFKRDGDVLTVFYTNRGDCPERILRSTVHLTPDWRKWRASPPEDVLAPELAYEGVNCPRVPSKGGPILEPAYQLRDPYVFRESGRDYLLYAVAGEQGIAIAEFKP